jgi:flagellar protein FliJ
VKRNRFRLATVLRVRTVQENLALAKLAQAQAEAAEARRVEAVRAAHYRDVLAAAPATFEGTAFQAHLGQGERLAMSVLHATAAVSSADVGVHGRMDEWSVAARRVSGLERLHERHNDAYRADVLLDEVLVTDERTAQRHHHRITAARALPRATADAGAPRALPRATAQQRDTATDIAPTADTTATLPNPLGAA